LLELELEERKRTAEALRQSQESLKQITDDLPVMVYQYTIDEKNQQHFTYLSSGAEAILGIPTATAQGDYGAVLRQMHPEDVPRINKSIEEAVIAKEKWADEFRIVHLDGEIRWVKASSIPIAQKDGKTFWNGIAMDVTEQKAMEEALRASRES